MLSLLPSLLSGERVPGPLQGGVGEDSGPRGRPEKAPQQAVCGGAAAARPVHVWQERHRHCFWTGWFFSLMMNNRLKMLAKHTAYKINTSSSKNIDKHHVH